jgi:ATP-dependent Lon protease
MLTVEGLGDAGSGKLELTGQLGDVMKDIRQKQRYR